MLMTQQPAIYGTNPGPAGRVVDPLVHECNRIAFTAAMHPYNLYNVNNPQMVLEEEAHIQPIITTV